MIRYLLDTDVTSKANEPKGDKNVQAWLNSVNDDELAISVVTLRERLEGVRKPSSQACQPRRTSLPTWRIWRAIS